jgi:hypothetical protein
MFVPYEGQTVAAAEANIQRCARVIGDGAFALPVVGAAEHQADLEILAGGLSQEGALKLCAALLQPKPDNPAGKKVSVVVHSCTVGHLAPEVEVEFLAALEQGGFANAACEAVIFGGRHHEGEADTAFGIRLNVALPLTLVDPLAPASAPHEAVRAEPEPPPETGSPTRAAPPVRPQTHVFRTQEHGRGFFGWIFLAALFAFNLAMTLWALTYWTGLFELADALASGGEWEARFRGFLGTELILAIWIAGTVVLALATYVTRGARKVVVEEVGDNPPVP